MNILIQCHVCTFCTDCCYVLRLTGPGVPVDLAALSQELPSCCKVCWEQCVFAGCVGVGWVGVGVFGLFVFACVCMCT